MEIWRLVLVVSRRHWWKIIEFLSFSFRMISVNPSVARSEAVSHMLKVPTPGETNARFVRRSEHLSL